MISYYLNVCYQIKGAYLIEDNEILVWNWHVKRRLRLQDTPVWITPFTTISQWSFLVTES